MYIPRDPMYSDAVLAISRILREYMLPAVASERSRNICQLYAFGSLAEDTAGQMLRGRDVQSGEWLMPLDAVPDVSRRCLDAWWTAQRGTDDSYGYDHITEVTS